MNEYTLDGIAIKNPSAINYEPYPLTKSTRTGNGDMVMELIAWKWKLNLSYEAITGNELDNILNILMLSRTMFHTLRFPHNGTIKQIVVYPGAIPAALHRAGSMGTNRDWVWKNVSLSLIER